MVRVIAHPTTGHVVTRSESNPEFGTIRLDSSSQQFQNNFFSTVNRTVFIRGNYDALVALGYTNNQVVPGKIIKLESFNPFYTKADGTPQEPKINPTTNEVVLTDGKPSYLEFQYTLDMNAQDKWVDNTPLSQEQPSEVSEVAVAEQSV